MSEELRTESKSAHDATRVCGIDGCRSGWVVASAAGTRVVPTLDVVIAEFDVIGIDMPVGLSDNGSRECDAAARKLLKKRACTVFPSPPRDLVHLDDYPTANRESRLRFGRGIPRQAHALWPKIREVDAIARAHPGRLVEIHPECSFVEMTGELPPSKHSDAGKIFRETALRETFGRLPERPSGAKWDDVLDAHAVLWSARRYVDGTHRPLGDGSIDRYGLAMLIVA